MKRSHRIVRGLHASCVKARKRAAGVEGAGRYDHLEEATEAAVALRALEQDGLLDPAMLDDFENAVAAAMNGALATLGPALQKAVADDVAMRLFEGKTYRNRLDRQLAVAASAVAASAMRERILVGAYAVVRQATGFVHEAQPAAVPTAGPVAWEDADVDPEDGAILKMARFQKKATPSGAEDPDIIEAILVRSSKDGPRLAR